MLLVQANVPMYNIGGSKFFVDMQITEGQQSGVQNRPCAIVMSSSFMSLQVSIHGLQVIV